MDPKPPSWVNGMVELMYVDFNPTDSADVFTFLAAAAADGLLYATTATLDAPCALKNCPYVAGAGKPGPVLPLVGNMLLFGGDHSGPSSGVPVTGTPAWVRYGA